MEMEQIPAISVRQPWAELILSGRKTIEIRSWVTDYRGQLWLHTGVQGSRKLEMAFGFSSLFKGGYVGSVILSAVVPFDQNRWKAWRTKHLDAGEYRAGLYAWLLSSPHRFASPIVAPGSLKLFYPSGEVGTLLQQANLQHHGM